LKRTPRPTPKRTNMLRVVRARAGERMLALGGVAVQRCRFPVVHPSDSTGQGSSQSLGRVDGASHGELDLLVDLAGQAPGLILGPHEVRFLIALRGAVPSQSWCVSEYADRAGEQQHRSMRNRHSWRLRRRDPAYPALPYRRIPTGTRGRVGGESRQCYAKGRLFSCRIDTIRILGKGDTHIHVEAWWAVPNKVPPINISPQQPPRCIRVCSRPNLRHHHQSAATHPLATNRTLMPPTVHTLLAEIRSLCSGKGADLGGDRK